MGYSIATPFASKKSRAEMLEFLEENYRSANEITGKTNFLYASDPRTNLDYAKKGILIGFDYNSGCPSFQREYAWQMCYWMAKTAGKKKNIRGKSLPFIIYDGADDILIVENKIISPKKEVEQIVVDDSGFNSWAFDNPEYKAHLDLTFGDMGVDVAKCTIREELVRLTILHKHIGVK